jgi:hypothetical protein
MKRFMCVLTALLLLAVMSAVRAAMKLTVLSVPTVKKRQGDSFRRENS